MSSRAEIQFQRAGPDHGGTAREAWGRRLRRELPVEAASRGLPGAVPGGPERASASGAGPWARGRPTHKMPPHSGSGASKDKDVCRPSPGHLESWTCMHSSRLHWGHLALASFLADGLPVPGNVRTAPQQSMPSTEKVARNH